MPSIARRGSFGALLTLAVLAAAPAHLAGAPQQSPAPPASAMTLSRHDPARPVRFAVAVEERGGAGEVSWSMRGEARFALLPAWDLPGPHPGGAEQAFERLGSFVALEAGQVMQFYAKEVSFQGSAHDSEGSHSWSQTTRDGVTVATCEAPETSTDRYADVADATLVRTSGGADLHFQWYLADGCRLGYGAELFGSPGADWQRLLTFHLSEEDLRHWDKVSRVNRATLTGQDAYEGATASLTATLTTGPPEPGVEVEVEAGADYEAWIPEGNLQQPGEPGNRLGLRFVVHQKGDASRPRRARLEIELQQVSREKGVCLNWPAGGSPDDGLKLRQEDNPQLEVTDPARARTKGAVEEVEVVVAARDYGAYGILHVSGKDLEERDVRVRVRGQDKADLAIPFDENHNHVADAWEKSWAGGLGGQETDDLDAAPAGDGHAGDALSLYEEYRGFRVSGGPELTAAGGAPRELVQGYHVRTDPRVKDVFVCDTLGAGIGAFRASGLQVHLVKPEETGASRSGAFNPHAANPNRGAWSLGEQFVLWIEAGGADLGEGAGKAVMKGDTPGVPRDCQRILVGGLTAGGAGRLTPSEETRVTLTHELAHATNVLHHGEKGIDIVKVAYLEDELDERGNVVHRQGDVEENPAGTWELVGEAGGSSSSGDTHCYLSYVPSFVQDPQGILRLWARNGSFFRGTAVNRGSARYSKSRFCDRPPTWELGPAGPPAPGRGDCTHQFCVNHLRH